LAPEKRPWKWLNVGTKPLKGFGSYKASFGLNAEIIIQTIGITVQRITKRAIR
jgi:hypothetical protein